MDVVVVYVNGSLWNAIKFGVERKSPHSGVTYLSSSFGSYDPTEFSAFG